MPAYHDYDIFMPLLDSKLRVAGKQVILGLHKGIAAGFLLNTFTKGKSRIIMSGIGGIKNTQVSRRASPLPLRAFPHCRIAAPSSRP